MARVTQLTLSLKSRPGVLAALARTLADARVNIAALSADTRAGRGKIHVVVQNLGQAKRALRHAKYRATEETAFVVRMRNKPGALARVAARLAKAGINIKSVYATAAGRSATIVFTVGSVTKARKILR
ncbi:MAG TPA: ACT domain-containing protein [Gaiellales bacterium]|nr:ACT domain-containing protein [Gaiellales bacterium]